MGTKRTPGTTIFSLEGAVKNAGLVEVPFGISLRDLVYEIGGGVLGDRPLKALQAGGASRGCIPPSMLDLTHRHRRPPGRDDHDRHRRDHRAGRRMPAWSTWPASSSGFFLDESCGKCVPCREGTKQMHRILDRLCEGQAEAGELAGLERLAKTIRSAAVCGMGGMAPSAVLTTLGHFREEFEGHLRRRQCAAGVCRDLAAREAVQV